MGKLYRRIVTMGMISLTMFLAWIYCILEYRKEFVYLGGVSIMLIASVYLMFIFIVDLKYLKDEVLQKSIDEAVEKLKESEGEARDEELERLVKALYVQVRKANNTLTSSHELDNRQREELKTTLSESINKLAKVVVKYNQSSSEQAVSAINEISGKLSETYEQLETMTLGINSVSGGIGGVSENVTSLAGKIDGISDKVLHNGGVLKEVSEDLKNKSVYERNPEESAKKPEVNEAPKVEDAPKVEEAPEKATPEENADLFGGVGLSQSDLDALIFGNEEADIIPFPVTEAEEPVAEEVSAVEEAPAAVEEAPAAIEEAPAPIAAPEPAADPNAKMSDDDIAALFAAMGAGGASEEPKAEEVKAEEPAVEEAPAPAPAADPNAKMSDDDIAALFAAMGAGGASEEPKAEEVKAEEPAVEEAPAPAPAADPNAKMSQDDIAALFASMGM